MDLLPKKVFEALEAKGVTELHHANSVLTACQFLRHQALLSRGSIQHRMLFQTSQSSDAVDVKYSLWFDVFTDSVDIHHRAKVPNAYGPVLFVMDLEKLKEENTGRVWVTKKNPTKWEDLNREERWFQSSRELEDNFTYGTFDQMIVFRHCGGELPLRGALKELILDDPEVIDEAQSIDFYSMGYGALKLAMTEGGLDIPIKKRQCGDSCRCKANYAANIERTELMFFPHAKRVA